MTPTPSAVVVISHRSALWGKAEPRRHRKPSSLKRQGVEALQLQGSGPPEAWGVTAQKWRGSSYSAENVLTQTTVNRKPETQRQERAQTLLQKLLVPRVKKPRVQRDRSDCSLQNSACTYQGQVSVPTLFLSNFAMVLARHQITSENRSESQVFKWGIKM